ncbi:hypothetical protein PTSG_05764 [Salpingoeca rosetta]|uniref:Methyltransferase type 12 domain-containing protein n=1 Tax=Salpingoeca rosetta (strain ATCC 50818 / BSB-021) TaxID=946362 RepID=F2UB59_SALR5|nr:uncharacterized protein PTSG_05764 [Salpingoeca rosetta]EGD74072.1 hypothetical protein PTSG_05764 [Salpingoeca rosetta]|eukprot:XP_004993634.1 hypothetical protein PTSG_05764 [Salpingoeca rosetta]
MSHGEEWFNEMASTWDAKPEIVANTKNVHAQIIKHLEERGQSLSSMDVMEVGSGTGLLSTLLAKDSKSLLAVDTSEKMLERLMDKVKESNLGNVSTLNEPLVSVDQLGGRTFDLIVMCLTLHHVDDIQGLTKTISAALNKGGQFLVFDFEKFAGSKSFHQMTDEQLKAAGVYHDQGFDASDFEALFGQANLKCIHAQSHFRMTMPDNMPKPGEQSEGHGHSHAHAHAHAHGHGHSHRQGMGEGKNEYPIIFAAGLKE